MNAGSGDRQADTGAESVEVALAVGEARGTMVTTDDDECVVGQPGSIKFLEQGPNGGIPGGDFAEIVSQILPHFWHIREEGRKFSLEIVGVDVPECLAASLDPFAVGVGWAEPIAEWLAGGPGGQQVAEVATNLVEDLLFRRLASSAFGDQFCDGLGELVDCSPMPMKGILLGVRSICWPARAPDLVRIAEEIPSLTEERWETGDGVVVDSATENRAGAGLPEVAAGEQGTAAGGTRGSTDMGVAKKDAALSKGIDVGRLDDVVEAAWAITLREQGCTAAPVVSKEKEKIGLFCSVCNGSDECR